MHGSLGAAVMEATSINIEASSGATQRDLSGPAAALA